jgi:hypothetical protein
VEKKDDPFINYLHTQDLDIPEGQSYVVDFTHYQTKQNKMMAHIIYCDEHKEMNRAIAFPKMYTTALGKAKSGSFCSPIIDKLDDGTMYIKDIK